MMKKIIYILLAMIFAVSCCNDAVKIVEPTNQPGSAKDRTEKMKLTPGKLLRINGFTAENCAKAVAQGLQMDVMLSDFIVFKEGVTEDDVVEMFVSAKAAMDSTGAKMWCVHLPYSTYDVASLDEERRQEGIAKLTWLMDLSMDYFRPQCFVVHPGTGKHFVGTEKYEPAKRQSQQSMRELQTALDGFNAEYGLNAILCVENCPRNITYDAKSLLDYLSAPGLEKVRICLDTGHALIPMNGEYWDMENMTSVSNGDAVQMLREIGTRLGTLHIQQNHGAIGREGTLDEHIEPWKDGLIDWGEFYDVLLKDCRYRGCVLYETSYHKEHKGAGSTMETVKANHEEVLYGSYLEYISK